MLTQSEPRSFEACEVCSRLNYGNSIHVYSEAAVITHMDARGNAVVGQGPEVCAREVGRQKKKRVRDRIYAFIFQLSSSVYIFLKTGC